MEGRVFIFSPTCTERFNKVNNISCYVGAASNKIYSISKSLNEKGVKVKNVMSPITTSEKNKKIIRGLSYRELGIDYYFMLTTSIRFLNRILASITYLFFYIFNVRKRDRVVIYNFFPEYIFICILGRLLNNPIILDIEDGVREDEQGIRGLANRLSFKLINSLVRKDKIVANTFLNSKYSNDNGFICYGAVSPVTKDYSCDDIIFSNEKVKVLFGGALFKETGTELYLEMLSNIAQSKYRDSFKFYITGYGDQGFINKIRNEYKMLDVEVLTGISQHDYFSILSECNIGLNLKIPSEDMSVTTFPSKVVEIINNDMLLISTKVSDIPYIFSENEVVFLSENTGQCLANCLTSINNDRGMIDSYQRKSKAKLVNVMSFESVGQRLKEFMF